jgi:hypothetical protein
VSESVGVHMGINANIHACPWIGMYRYNEFQLAISRRTAHDMVQNTLSVSGGNGRTSNTYIDYISLLGSAQSFLVNLRNLVCVSVLVVFWQL